MKRFYGMCMVVVSVLAVLIGCSEPTAPRVPNLAVVSNACNSISYPNYGGIWAVRLNPTWVQVDSSVAAQNWFGLPSGKYLEAWVWRDNASFAGNQLYCVDTTASYTKLVFSIPGNTGVIGLLPGNTGHPNNKGIAVYKTGTAKVAVVYNGTSIRDTSDVTAVP